MKREFNELVEYIDAVIETQNENLTMFRAMDDYINGVWKYDDFADVDWIHESVSSEPADSVKDGAALFDTFFPNPRIDPLGPATEDLEQAELIERGLRWQMRKMLERKGNPQGDILLDALKYDRICRQLVFLPYQEKVLRTFGKADQKTLDYAKKDGPFTLIRRDPSEVFPIWNDHCLEAVITRTVSKIEDIVAFWGPRANKLKRWTKGKNAVLNATLFDYHSLHQRVVFAIPQGEDSKDQDASAGNIVKIIDEENKMNFIPWIIEDGGEELQPLLSWVYKGKLWDTINILETLLVSEIMAYTLSPRYGVEGYNPDAVEVDFGEPGRFAYVPPGNELKQLRPPEVDQALTYLLERVGHKIQKSTISPNVQAGQFPQGAAYASINEMIQLGIKKLNRAKRLAERAYSRIYKTMLYWVDYSDEELISFPRSSAGGEQVIITGDLFDSQNLYLTVKLKPEEVLDDPASINAALMAKEAGISEYGVLDRIGIEHPYVERARRWREQEEETRHQINLEMMKFQAQMNMQAAAQQAQQQAIQQEQQQAQGQMPRVRGRGNERLRGRPWNPAEGGMSPEAGNPGTSSPEVQSPVNRVQ